MSSQNHKEEIGESERIKQSANGSREKDWKMLQCYLRIQSGAMNQCIQVISRAGQG